MFRTTLKISLLALGLAAAAPLSAQQPGPAAPRPARTWAAERPGQGAAQRGPRRRHRRNRHAHRAHARNRAQVRAEWRGQRGWRRI